MLRSSLRKFLVSPIEASFLRYCQGKELSEEMVSSFILSQELERPMLLNDLVFLHRLAQSFPDLKNPKIDLFLQTSLKQFPLDHVSSRGITLLLSCAADLKLTMCIPDLVEEYFSRPEEDAGEPRLVARICKALIQLNERDDLLIQKANRLISILKIDEVEIKHIFPIFGLANSDSRIEVSTQLQERALLLVPFMDAGDAKKLVNIIEKYPLIATKLKKHMGMTNPRLRSKGERLLPQVDKAPHYGYVRKIDLR